MSKIKTASVSILALAATIFVLMNNKRQMAAQSEPELDLSVPVRVAQAKMEPLVASFSVMGRVEANNDVVIVSETEGRVISVHTEVGDDVKPGAAIVKVDDELKQAAFAAAEANYETAKRDFVRYEVLHGDSTVSESRWEAARLAYKSAEAQFVAARRLLQDTRVTSPISGIVASRSVDVGVYVKHGDVIANVVDVSRLKVLVNVAEKDVFRLKPGDAVSVSVDVYPAVVFGGTIYTISEKADAAHTYAVEVELGNRVDHPLKAGMFARVEFFAGDETSVLAIPRSAIAGSLRSPQVYVVHDEKASLRTVVVGAPVGGMLPVLSGLQGGESIVTSGQGNLRDGAPVSIVQ